MFIDCHLHTRLLSSCSLLNPDEACELAVQRGLDAVVFTEHHQTWPEPLLERFRGRYPDLSIFAGVELTLAEGYDVVAISAAPLPVEIIRPFRSLRELRRAFQPIRDESFLFVAHPFRYADKHGPELEAVLDWVDGVEMNSVNILRSAARQRRLRREAAGTGDRSGGKSGGRSGGLAPGNAGLYERARASRDLTGLYNSDGHFAEAVGAVCNRFDAPVPADTATLVALLRTARPEQSQDSTRLAAILD